MKKDILLISEKDLRSTIKNKIILEEGPLDSTYSDFVTKYKQDKESGVLASQKRAKAKADSESEADKKVVDKEAAALAAKVKKGKELKQAATKGADISEEKGPAAQALNACKVLKANYEAGDKQAVYSFATRSFSPTAFTFSNVGEGGAFNMLHRVIRKYARKSKKDLKLIDRGQAQEIAKTLVDSTWNKITGTEELSVKDQLQTEGLTFLDMGIIAESFKDQVGQTWQRIGKAALNYGLGGFENWKKNLPGWLSGGAKTEAESKQLLKFQTNQELIEMYSIINYSGILYGEMTRGDWRNSVYNPISEKLDGAFADLGGEILGLDEVIALIEEGMAPEEEEAEKEEKKEEPAKRRRGGNYRTAHDVRISIDTAPISTLIGPVEDLEGFGPKLKFQIAQALIKKLPNNARSFFREESFAFNIRFPKKAFSDDRDIKIKLVGGLPTQIGQRLRFKSLMPLIKKILRVAMREGLSGVILPSGDNNKIIRKEMERDGIDFTVEFPPGKYSGKAKLREAILRGMIRKLIRG